MENRIQIILETIQKIVEFKEEPKSQSPSMRRRKEQRGKRRFTKPLEPRKPASKSSRAALLSAVESGDKAAMLAAIRRLKADLETED